MTLLRSALFNLLVQLWTGLLGVLVLPLLLAPGSWLRRPLRFWARSVLVLLRLLCGIRVRVTGAEHLPRHGPALIAAKHQSAFDTIVWFALLPDAAYVLKRELLRVPIHGWIARHAGMIAVDRAGGSAALRGLLRQGAAAAARGRQLVIFPEGTRVAPGARVPFQPGIAALAAATGLPVIPVGTDSGRCWGRRAFRKRAGTITVAVRPPLPHGLSRQALLSALRAAVEAPPQEGPLPTGAARLSTA